jgi:hypothetical protein
MTTAPSARAAIETMLRASAEDFTRLGKPRGCLVVLGAIHADDGNEAVHRELRERRAENVELLARRLERGLAEGELPAGIDCRAIATFYATLQHGMSIQARDGASRKTLLTVAASAMTAWDGLVSSRNDKPRDAD